MIYTRWSLERRIVMCKVSIIIPCYNVEYLLLDRCLKSIYAQTFSDYEVIIIDDGSNIEYLEMFQKIQAQYDNLIIHRQTNKGVSAARNCGVTLSHGDYIVFVDADDYLISSFLEDAVNVAEDNKADIVIGMNITTFTKDMEHLEIVDSGNINFYDEHNISDLQKWMLGRIKFCEDSSSYLGQGPWNRLVTRMIALNFPFDEGLQIGEDIVWNLQIIQKAMKVCVVEKTWYVYYMNPTSSSRKVRMNAIKESSESLFEMSKYLDLDKDEQFFSYCMRCWSDLKRIYRCYLLHDTTTNKQEEYYLYTSEPWNILGSKRFKKLSKWKNLYQYFLYRYRMIFKYYQLKSRLMTFRSRKQEL